MRYKDISYSTFGVGEKEKSAGRDTFSRKNGPGDGLSSDMKVYCRYSVTAYKNDETGKIVYLPNFVSERNKEYRPMFFTEVDCLEALCVSSVEIKKEESPY
ncbi:hypothetical protein KJ925_05780 [Patescibacteria group bacterium]|nr:hypothetical protein [Patescibacteria group bacterium]